MLYYSCIGPSVWYLWSVSWTIVLMLLYYRPHALQYHHTPRCLGCFWHCWGSTHSRPLSPWHSMIKKWTAVCVDRCQFYYTSKKLAASVPEATHYSFGPEPYIWALCHWDSGSLEEVWRAWSSQQENSFTSTNRTLNVCSDIFDRVSYHIQAD